MKLIELYENIFFQNWSITQKGNYIYLKDQNKVNFQLINKFRSLVKKKAR